MRTDEIITSAAEIYGAGCVAEQMAKDLFAAYDEAFGGSPSRRAESLIGRHTRTTLTREQGERFARQSAEELAANIGEWQTWSNGQEVIQRKLDLIQMYRKMADTGLDSHAPSPLDRHQSAAITAEIRRLKNDGRRLIAQSFAMLKANNISRIVLFTGTYLDYSEWAKEVVNKIRKDGSL